MSKSNRSSRKYTQTDLKHRQRLLMLLDLCIGGNLLLAWVLPGGKPFMLMLGLSAVGLAFVSRTDPRENMNNNVRIAVVVVFFLAVTAFLTIDRWFFWIIGLTELLALILFAAWPYRKRILKPRKK